MHQSTAVGHAERDLLVAHAARCARTVCARTVARASIRFGCILHVNYRSSRHYVRTSSIPRDSDMKMRGTSPKQTQDTPHQKNEGKFTSFLHSIVWGACPPKFLCPVLILSSPGPDSGILIFTCGPHLPNYVITRHLT